MTYAQVTMVDPVIAADGHTYESASAVAADPFHLPRHLAASATHPPCAQCPGQDSHPKPAAGLSLATTHEPG